MGGKKKKAAGDAGKGEKVFKNLCAVCHQLNAHHTGPKLASIVGRPIASAEGFGYSDVMKGKSDQKWSEAQLDKYIKSPADYAPGNAMAFAGIPAAKDRADLIAYLKNPDV
eukprot:NODE_7650_length_445_cov_29.351010_g6808_i0.p2 GENE.NODE_7650_length_445_cov_29.351010_g6808_i0~~NODE_7650_length_445_cov_29.351010_g6808_i0.p2  ORF type:complete len:123 (-),score=33.92 NODE_7650_length_445_cov_29.351010_g6808_i0:77-409(-)